MIQIIYLGMNFAQLMSQDLDYEAKIDFLKYMNSIK